MFHEGGLVIADLHLQRSMTNECLTSMRWSTRNILVYKLLYIGQPSFFFYIQKSLCPYVHMWPFYREDPHQGVKRYSWGMCAHYSFPCRGGKAVLFSCCHENFHLVLKWIFLEGHCTFQRARKKTDPWMGILYLSTFAHFTSLNTPFKTAVPETTRGKKEAKINKSIP